MSVQNRIKDLITHFSDGNLKQFCDRFGFKYSTLQSVINDHGNPRATLLIEIIETCGINADWLLTGNGKMIGNNDISLSIRELPPGVPIFDIQATAGAVALPNMDQSEVPVGYIDMPAFRGCDFAVTVRGNSMADYIIHGDVIICKRYDFTSYINYGQAYVVVTSQEVMVKYVKKGKDQMHVALVSENKEFDTIELPLKAILHLYVVKGVIRQATI
jgi:repressor LexA